MKSFVITLTDLEESVQVAQRCIRSAARFGINVDTFDGVKAKDAQKVREAAGIPIEGFHGKWSRFDNVVACFMSHYTLWEKCAQGNENFLIFEHDAVVVDAIPTCYFKGVLSLGKPSYGNYLTPPMLGVNKLCSKQYFPGAHGYIVKPSAAKVLVKKAKEEACPADVFLHNMRFSFLEEYYPWSVEARDSFSTVQNMNGVQAKHKYQESPELYRLL